MWATRTTVSWSLLHSDSSHHLWSSIWATEPLLLIWTAKFYFLFLGFVFFSSEFAPDSDGWSSSPASLLLLRSDLTQIPTSVYLFCSVFLQCASALTFGTTGCNSLLLASLGANFQPSYFSVDVLFRLSSYCRCVIPAFTFSQSMFHSGFNNLLVDVSFRLLSFSLPMYHSGHLIF